MLCAVILAPFVLAVILAFLGGKLGKNIGWYVLPIPIVIFAWFLTQIPAVSSGAGAAFLLPWLPAFGVNLSLAVTGLGLLFALLISGVGVLVFWYSIGYLGAGERLVNYYCFMLIFMGSMLGVVTSNNLMLTYLFWEGTSFSSFLLIGFWYDKYRSRYGAQKALFVTVVGGFCMFAAFVLIGLTCGTFELSELRGCAALLHSDSLYPAITILLCLGAFTKSAQIPFHIWLPDAMEAPTPISCYLHSATMVKAGIYLLLVFSPILGGTELWFLTVSGVGLLSLLWGAYRAMKQYDLKAILANSTISQLGLVITLVGYGSPAALAAACFHLINHSAFKGTLFLVTGMVDHGCGTRDIRRLRGLARVMPLTAVCAACGTLAMAGLPPFNGFLSKELFFDSSLAAVNGNLAFLGGAAWIFPAIAVLASAFTFVYCLVILCRVFLGGQVPSDLPLAQPGHHAPAALHEPRPLLLIPTALLASLTLLIAVFPNQLSQALLEPAAAYAAGQEVSLHIAFWHGFNWPLLMTLIVIGVGLSVYLNFDRFRDWLFRLPKLLSSNDAYDFLVPNNGLPHAGNWLIRTHMTGRLSDYVLFVNIFFALSALGVMFLHGAFYISFDDLHPISPFEVVWAVAIVASCIVMLRARQRTNAIFALGMVGYSVSFFFVLFSAPDLALTQLLVETVSLVLFFLAFRYLPRSVTAKPMRRSRRRVNLLVSAAVGLSAMLVTMVAHSNKMFASIADFYIENAKILGGGNNVVNVILVDFRGYDTMGEITVITIAAIGVYVLIRLCLDHSDQEEVQRHD